MDHLTENEIQDFLDGNLQSDVTSVKFHLDTCNSCSAQMEQYRTLYSDLSEDLVMPLSENFADYVIEKVTVEHQSRQLSSVGLLVLAGFISSFGIVFYYIKNGLSLQALSGVYAWLEAFTPVYTQLKSLGTLFSATGLTTILFGTLILFLVGTVDQFVVKNYFRRLKTY